MKLGSCISLFTRHRLLANRSAKLSAYYGVRWSSSSVATRQWSTPLAKNLAEAIEVTGPISIAAYMRQCLTSIDGGYYTSHTPGKDQFGRKGDFITSPEISQIFGELTGLWFVAEWMKQGKPNTGVDLIEMGPGRGTLMDDMLRTLRNFEALASSINNIYLVEASPALRDSQKQLLCGDRPLKELENGYESVSKHLDVPVTWYEDIRFVPNGPSRTPFIIAHEFFDALPIHAFQSVAPNPNPESQTLETPTGPLPLTDQTSPPSKSKSNQWRELVVTPTPSPPTPPSSPFPQNPLPEFQLSLSQTSTPPSLLLPTLLPRYSTSLATPNTIIEISPESHRQVADIARRIGGPSPSPSPSSSPSSSASASASAPPAPASGRGRGRGAALIIDYSCHPLPSGPKTPSGGGVVVGVGGEGGGGTLRGIHAHALVSPLSLPGKVDVSADVDFLALADAALNASEEVEVHGPTSQGEWLERMGVWERVRAMEQKEKGDGGGKDREGRAVRKGVERLVNREEGAMGRVYKVMAIVPERGGRGRPVGFGGGVEEG